MIEARKLESSFDRLQKGEVIVADIALHAFHAVVGVNDQRHLVGFGSAAVIVLVPDVKLGWAMAK